ncbi:MAG TPA: DNA polymerase III subunit delta [bacterium]|nr:DNA polymerase III subunit delta [bacterium]
MAAKTSFPPKATELIDFKKDGGVRVFFSTERFLIRCLKQSAEEAGRAAGHTVASYDGTEPSQLREAISASREIGFFATRKIVLLDFFIQGKEKLDAATLTLLESAIAKPEQDNLLLLFFNDLDKRTKFYKAVTGKGYKQFFHELSAPEKTTVTAFIVSQFGPVKPDQRLINHFLQKESGDLFHIETEVGKLRLWAESAGKRSLTLADAEPMLSSFGEEKIFKIMDHLVKGDKVRAIELYRDLKTGEGEQKVHPVLISLLMKHFRVILDGRILQSKKRSGEIPALLQENNAFYLKYSIAEVLARYKNRTVIAALNDAAKLELGMKGVYEVAMPDVSSSIEQFMLKYF